LVEGAPMTYFQIDIFIIFWIYMLWGI
jgi:hypothetical protein